MVSVCRSSHSSALSFRSFRLSVCALSFVLIPRFATRDAAQSLDIPTDSVPARCHSTWGHVSARLRS